MHRCWMRGLLPDYRPTWADAWMMTNGSGD